MRQLVGPWERRTYDGIGFCFYLLYSGEHGKRRQKSLSHCDGWKAERQRSQLERKLRIGAIEPASMSLRMFAIDSLDRTGKQIRESTKKDYRGAMEDFIRVVGNIDYQKVALETVSFIARTV